MSRTHVRAFLAVVIAIGAASGAGPARATASVAAKPKLSLKGSPVVGTRDTLFTFRAVLTGGEDSEDLYCLTAEWIWEEQADSSLNESDCPPFRKGETTIERVFTEEQTFHATGTHRVRLVLHKGDREVASAGTTVTVRQVP